MTTVAPLLAAEHVDLHYGRVQVLFDVSIGVEQGEFVALLGTNGAGKSTFLKAVSNLSPVSRGTITFQGEDITGLAPDEIAARGLAHVPGGRGSLPDLTVAENLRLGGHLLRRQKPQMAAGIEFATSLFPWLGQRPRQLAGTLSGGEQQMLAIARALVLRPSLLMVDELSLGLAPIVVEDLMGRLRLLNDEGVTILIVEQVRFSGSAAGLGGRDDLLRSVFLGA
jgi:branched-chain amino acid transport system ATP-binding protein